MRTSITWLETARTAGALALMAMCAARFADSKNDSAWFGEGRKLHDREFGPGLLVLRMKDFAASQGWTSIWEAENSVAEL